MAGRSQGLRFQVLGALRFWRDGTEAATGPRQQAYLLALLLARAGAPLSISEMVDEMWGPESPASAVNILHKYIGAIRRLVEPDLPTREAGTYIQRRGDSYVMLTGTGELDLTRFRGLITTAKSHLAEQRAHLALDRFVDALALWHGSAGAGFDHGLVATPLFQAIDNEFYVACTEAAELACAVGRPSRALPALLAAAGMAPLNETVQANLITTLAAAGRQAEALDAFTTVRHRLADALGIDPGPLLRTAHQNVLNQRIAVAEPTKARGGSPHLLALVGRDAELDALRQLIRSAADRRSGVIVVQGEPGGGKTALLMHAAQAAEQRGFTVLWGRCLSGDGAPTMWPWVDIVRTLLEALPERPKDHDISQLVQTVDANPVAPVANGDSANQFRLFEKVVTIMREAAQHGPLLVVVDDIHWADQTSLKLLAHLCVRLPVGCAMICALRDHAPTPSRELLQLLAEVNRLPHHERILLRPLDVSHVAALLAQEAGIRPSDESVLEVHRRTNGNPLFVRELSRHLNAAGALEPGVPATIAEVVVDRTHGLGDDCLRLLRVAALVGHDAHAGLLAAASDLDASRCLELLPILYDRSLLEPVPDSPFVVRFIHDLIRESVADAIPPPSVPGLHLRIADALEAGAHQPERLGHHLWEAGPLADPARTVTALTRAGRSASAKSALIEAERHLRRAALVARQGQLDEPELACLSLLIAVVAMRAWYVVDVVERAEHLARGLGRQRDAATFLYSRFIGHTGMGQTHNAGPLAGKLSRLGQASDDPLIQAFGLYAWGIHHWTEGRVGEAYRHLLQAGDFMLSQIPARDENRLGHDLQVLSSAMLAWMTLLHGDAETARTLFDAIDQSVFDDPFSRVVLAGAAATGAAQAGDQEWAASAARRGLAHDSSGAYEYMTTYPRLAACWARAHSGPDRVGATVEAERLINEYLLPPTAGTPRWYTLLADMWLAVGDASKANDALDRAENFMETSGERDSECLHLLLRARVMEATGQPWEVVRATAEEARLMSVERQAGLFADRAAQFLAQHRRTSNRGAPVLTTRRVPDEEPVASRSPVVEQ